MNRIILILLAGIASCSGSFAEYRRLIWGDWVSAQDSLIRSKPRFFSFMDSVSTIMSTFGEFDTYSIEGNKIKLKYDSSSKIPVLFTIQKLDEDSLVVTKSQNGSEAAITYRMKKIKSKNNLSPAVIQFISSGCFGTCPSMVIEISTTKTNNHSTHTLLFHGIQHTEQEGWYGAILDSSAYQTILLKIRNLPLGNIQPKYEAGWTDDMACGLNLITADTTISTYVYGYDKEPVELRILLNYLMTFYRRVNLKQLDHMNLALLAEPVALDSLFNRVNPPREPIPAPY